MANSMTIALPNLGNQSGNHIINKKSILLANSMTIAVPTLGNTNLTK